jgi:hypothetical protein
MRGAWEHEHHRKQPISFENMNIIDSLRRIPGVVSSLVTFGVGLFCVLSALYGRKQMTHKIHGSIRGLVAAGAVSPDWGWFLSQMFALDKDGSTEMWAENTVPDWALWSQHQPISSAAKKDILVWVRMGSECLWKGLFPIRFTPSLHAVAAAAAPAPQLRPRGSGLHRSLEPELKI